MKLSSQSSPARIIKSVPFFNKLNPQEAAALTDRMVVRTFGSDRVIFHHGDPGGLLYIIVQGKVKITHTTAEGQEALLAILGAGDFFGELALLDDSPRSATAEAVSETETLTLHREEFIQFIRGNPDFSLHVLHTLAQHIRRLNSQLSDVFFLDLPARVARTLLLLAEQHGRSVPEGTLIDLMLTQTDLAEMTGATRVSINKSLGLFRRANWISTKGRKFTIRNTQALQDYIQVSGRTVPNH